MPLYEVMIAITWYFVMLWASRLFIVVGIARQIGRIKDDIIKKVKGEDQDDSNNGGKV